MAIKPEVVIGISSKGAAKTTAEIGAVNAALRATSKSSDSLSSSLSSTTATASRLTDTAGDLGEKFDKFAEQKVGRVFKATDRLNSILGQVKGAFGLVGIAVGGLAAAYTALTKSTTGATKATNFFQASVVLSSRALKKHNREMALAKELGKSVGGIHMVEKADRDQISRLSAEYDRLNKSLKALVKTEDERAAQAQKLRAKGVSVVDAGDLAKAARETRERMSEIKADISNIYREAQILSADDDFEPMQARTSTTGPSVAPGVPGWIQSIEAALGAQQTPSRYGQGIASGLSGMYDSVMGREQEGGIFSSMFDGLKSFGDEFAYQMSDGPIAEGFQAFSDRAEEMKKKDEAIYSFATSFEGLGRSMGQAALSAIAFGGSVKKAVNQAAIGAFYTALLDLGMLAFKIPLAMAFAPAQVPVLTKAAGAAAAQLAVAGGIAGATGGLSMSGSPSGGGGGGSASAPGGYNDRGFERRNAQEDDNRETVLNVNFVADGSQGARSNAYDVAIGIQDAFRIAGLPMGSA